LGLLSPNGFIFVYDKARARTNGIPSVDRPNKGSKNRTTD